MNEQTALWSDLVSHENSRNELYTAMQRAAIGLSDMVGRIVSNDTPRVDTVPVGQVVARAGDPEASMVGIYLLLEGGLNGQAILILSQTSALKVADLLMGERPGTTTRLGSAERSALAEACNVAISHFLNAVASRTEMKGLLKPSKATVMEGKLHAMLDVIVAPMAAVRDDLLIIETVFQDTQNTVQGRLWILPDPGFENHAKNVWLNLADRDKIAH
jgi:chemotaxis protein CheC